MSQSYVQVKRKLQLADLADASVDALLDALVAWEAGGEGNG
jgi:hypothetical protein